MKSNLLSYAMVNKLEKTREQTSASPRATCQRRSLLQEVRPCHRAQPRGFTAK